MVNAVVARVPAAGVNGRIVRRTSRGRAAAGLDTAGVAPVAASGNTLVDAIGDPMSAPISRD